MVMKIFAGNLSCRTSEEQVRKIFQEYGTVEKVELVYDRGTGRSRGFAFVFMRNDHEARNAIQQLNNTNLDGKTMKVDQAGPKEKGRGERDKQKKGMGTDEADTGQFINPYTFIPVKAVREERLCNYFTEGNHFQHKFHADSHSGRIVCSFTTESEIFIGAGIEEERNDETQTPAKIQNFMLHGKPAIPPSTLKGMISSLMEAASNSALRVLGNNYYTRRQDFSTEVLKKIGMVIVREGKKSILPLKTGEPTREIPRAIDPSYPVYLDGYNKEGNAEGFLSTKNFLGSGELVDYSASQRFYYIDTGTMERKIKRISKKNGEIIEIFLGYQLSGSAKNHFITEEDFNKKTDQEKRAYKKGLFKIFGIGPERKDITETKKRHEFFLFYPDNPEKVRRITVSEAEADFHILSDDRSSHNTDDMDEMRRLPYSPKGRTRDKEAGMDLLRIRDGDIVYYEDNGRGNATKISFSACWRDFCGRTKKIKDHGNDAYGYFTLVDKHGFLLPPFMANQRINNPKELKLTPVCSLLGFVEEKKEETSEPGLALAGRVFFSPGMLSPCQDLNKVFSAEKTLKILDCPKPPCPEFYFYQNNNPAAFISKEQLKPDGNYLPRGRKWYLHHHNPSPYAPEKSDYVREHFRQISRIRPIQANCQFLFTVDFFNLADAELGMLLYALRPTEEFRHVIGMGKPLGLGKIEVEILNVLFVNRQCRYGKDALFTESFFHTQTGTNQERLSEIEGRFSGEEYAFYKNRFCPAVKNTHEKDKAYFLEKFKAATSAAYGKDWLIQLENPGNPDSTEIPDTPVQYPNLKKGGDEESFKWWMRNAGKEKDAGRRPIPGLNKTLQGMPASEGAKAPVLPFNPKK